MTKIFKLSAIAAAALIASSAFAAPTYVTGVWGTDTIHILDETFASVSSFTAGSTLPNGVAANDSLIWSGHFTSQEVIGYNHAGVEQFRWGNASLGNLQGLALVGNLIAVASAGTTSFYDSITGAFSYSFANSGSGVEGLTYDGALLWEIDDRLIGRDPLTGAVVSAIANAASGCAFNGTGIADAGANALALACTGGEWFVVSKADGSVFSSGNNGLQMFGLDNISQGATVPEPSMALLLGLALVAASATSRRRPD